MPVNLAVARPNLGGVRPQSNYDTFAAARVPAINPDARSLATAARTAGFQPNGNDLYTHADGSWIALTDQGRIERGVGSAHFWGLPNAVRTGQTVAPAPGGGNNGQAGINLAQYQLTPPSPAHGLLAVAQVPLINPDSQSLRSSVTPLGFQAQGNDHYVHTDGSWIALVNGRIERGYNTLHFRGLPRAPQNQPVAPPGSVGRNYAVVAFVEGNERANRRNLVSKGFVEQPQNWFAHADGSWVALGPGTPTYGYGNQQLNAQSFVPPPPPAAYANGSYTQYQTLPSSTWAWYQQNTALGKLPIISAYDAPSILPGHGFLQSPSQNGMTRWTHPDGSYVDVSDYGQLRLGWQQWTLGQLPYNNRTSAP